MNTVYQEISEKLGRKMAEEIYHLFKGQQGSFPMRFYNPEYTKARILLEYNGSNVNALVIK